MGSKRSRPRIGVLTSRGEPRPSVWGRGIVAVAMFGIVAVAAFAGVVAADVVPSEPRPDEAVPKAAPAGALEATASDAPAPVAAVAAGETLPVDSDPLVLARFVDRAGDAAVLAWMTPDRTGLMRGLAFQAARFMRAPELALPILVGAMAGSDPDLSPCAARATLAIVEGFGPGDLAQREADLSRLEPVVGELQRVAEAPRSRADIAVMAATAAVVLSEALKWSGVASADGEAAESADEAAR